MMRFAGACVAIAVDGIAFTASGGATTMLISYRTGTCLAKRHDGVGTRNSCSMKHNVAAAGRNSNQSA